VITIYDAFGKEKKIEALIYYSVQISDDGEVIGSIESQPVYPFSRFNQEEIAEVNRVKNISNQPIRWDLVNRINQSKNEIKVERLFALNGEGGYDEEDWIIHNLAERKSNENGCLVFDDEKMIKVKDLSEAEQKAIGYNKSEQRLQSVSITPKNDNEDIGNGGVFAVITVVSVLLISGIAISKKKVK
jgi:hypothetical protein